MQYLDTISKTTECSVCFQGKPFNITVIQDCAVDDDESEQFYEDLQDLLELTPQKDVLFITGDWNAKVGSQETPGVVTEGRLLFSESCGQKKRRENHFQI